MAGGFRGRSHHGIPSALIAQIVHKRLSWMRLRIRGSSSFSGILQWSSQWEAYSGGGNQSAGRASHLPRGGGLLTQCIQDEQRCAADLFETAVKANLAVASRMSRASDPTNLETLMNKGGCPRSARELAMAAARWVFPQAYGPGKHQPSLG